MTIAHGIEKHAGICSNLKQQISSELLIQIKDDKRYCDTQSLIYHIQLYPLVITEHYHRQINF